MRQGQEVRERYYCCEISVCGDEVALLDYSRYGVLKKGRISAIWSRVFGEGIFCPSRSRGAYLVGARPHESIVAQVSTDVGGDDLPIDTIFRHEILVRASGWLWLGARGSVSIAISVSARHDEGERLGWKEVVRRKETGRRRPARSKGRDGWGWIGKSRTPRQAGRRCRMRWWEADGRTKWPVVSRESAEGQDSRDSSSAGEGGEGGRERERERALQHRKGGGQILSNQKGPVSEGQKRAGTSEWRREEDEEDEEEGGR